MNKAFILGAGLGTRLRPLTDQLPKPLIPVMHKPLISHAFDHLLESGVKEFIINTHHLPDKFAEAFPEKTYQGADLDFVHEPVLLETAGGIANIADRVRDGSFLVYNGDILSDVPLAPLLQEHEKGEDIVTLVLRSRGPGLHISINRKTGAVNDIRNMLRTGKHGQFQFTGIYAVRPDFLDHLEPGKVESVIPIFLKLISSGLRIGSVIIDEGTWLDLGDRFSYLRAHKQLTSAGRKGRLAYEASALIHPESQVSSSATLAGCNAVGPGAVVADDAVLEDCILWPGARVEAGARLKRCIVRSGMTAVGNEVDKDF